MVNVKNRFYKLLLLFFLFLVIIDIDCFQYFKNTSSYKNIYKT